MGGKGGLSLSLRRKQKCKVRKEWLDDEDTAKVKLAH